MARNTLVHDARTRSARGYRHEPKGPPEKILATSLGSPMTRLLTSPRVQVAGERMRGGSVVCGVNLSFKSQDFTEEYPLSR